MEKLTNITLAQLHPHPAQMRTHIGPEIADLVLSLHTNGWFPDSPLVVAPATLAPDGQYVIVKGHRRALAWFLLKWACKPEDLTSRAAVDKALESFGPEFMPMYDFFGNHTDIEMPEVWLMEGDYQQQILDLLSDNFGNQTPDIAGLLRTLKAARDAGASWKKIANTIARSEGWVRDHVALLDMDPAIVAAINAGKWSPAAALLLTKLPGPQRAAAERLYVRLLNAGKGDSYLLSMEHVKRYVGELAAFKPPEMNLLATTPYEYWRNLVVTKLWAEAIKTNEAATWDMVYRAITDTNTRYFELCLAQYVNASYATGTVYNDRLVWEVLLPKYAPEVTCEACPLNKLRDGHLRNMHSRASEEHYPCMRAKVGPCADAPIPPAPDLVEVPYWIQSGGAKVEAQVAVKAWEKAEAAAAAEDKLPVTRNLPGADSPMQKQRRAIAEYQQRHTELACDHVLAAPCKTCEFLTESSPVKSDENAPPCQWAVRLKDIGFVVRVPDSGFGLAFPVCRQYRHAGGPKWAERIPAWPEDPGYDRYTLLRMIRGLAYDQNHHVAMSNRTVLEVLTGRGKTKDENMSGAFAATLTAEEPTLTDRQLMMLLALVYAEWEVDHYDSHAGDGRYTLPGYLLPGLGIYQTVAWETFWQQRAQAKKKNPGVDFNRVPDPEPLPKL